jgi:hypothetical protein
VVVEVGELLGFAAILRGATVFLQRRHDGR